MAEWMKARDSKSRILKGIGGSNPSLSAIFDGVDYTDNKKTRRMGEMEGKEVLKLGSWEDRKLRNWEDGKRGNEITNGKYR